jgi:outer membrane protease
LKISIPYPLNPYLKKIKACHLAWKMRTAHIPTPDMSHFTIKGLEKSSSARVDGWVIMYFDWLNVFSTYWSQQKALCLTSLVKRLAITSHPLKKIYNGNQ